MSGEALAARVDELEMRLTHQDVTIEELNRVVTEQWTEIDRLKRLVRGFEDQLAEAMAERERPTEPPPPHY